MGVLTETSFYQSVRGKKSHGVLDRDRVSLRAGRPPVWAGNGRSGWAMREGKNEAAGVREREESENDKRRITRWAVRACGGLDRVDDVHDDGN